MSDATAQEIANAAIRESIAQGLDELTQPQRDLFRRIYSELPEEKLAEAHDLIQRTIRKSRAGR